MSDRLELALRPRGTGDATTLAELLAGAAPADLRLDAAVLLLEHDGAPVWPAEVTIGDLPRTVVQFEAAADRLERGEVAAVRQGVDDHDNGIHLLLEPSDERVGASMAVVHDPEWRHQYPAAWWGENEAWYAYLAEHRQQLTASPGDSWTPFWFTGVPLAREPLVEALRREAQLGRDLHDALGIEFDETRFE